MDVSNRSRPHLPPLSSLDEKSEDIIRSTTTSTMGTTTHTVTALASPTYPPHTGGASAHFHPPPQHNTMKPWSSTSPSVHTPPESRRASEEEKDALKPAPAGRQMLPSLSEIMRVETPAFASAPPPPSSLLAGGHLPPRQSTSNMSPPSPTSRRPLPATGSSSLPPYASARSEPPARAAYPPTEPMQPSFGRGEDGRPPASTSFGSFREHSPHAPPHSDSAMGPPPSNVPYGYAPYQSRHDSHVQPPSGAHFPPAPMYAAPPPASASAAAPAAVAAPAWKLETKLSQLANRPRHDSYKDTIKRLLDVQHVEYALGEISQNSNILLNFANQFREQLYAAQQRPGTAPQHLPNVADLDEMASKAKIQLDQLLSIREFIATQQQAAAYNDLQQQHHHATTRLPEKHGLAPGETSPNHDGHHDDRHHPGGFGPDAKKPRRGRAAPPGRCHSCNRAETPEWRRGPDGARTLCNACGLHYAKLTRKNNNNNNNSNAAAAAVTAKPGMGAPQSTGAMGLVGKDGR